MKARLAVLGVGLAVMTVYDFAAPDAKSFQEPSLARIMYWHLPSAMICSFFLFLSAYLGWRYLSKRDLAWDARLATSIELAALFGTLTMVTGILFSKVQWGEWWQWDPRQTSFLLVLFLMAVSLALRGGFADAKKRAAVSSAYALLSLLPALFLIAVFPRLPQVKAASFHPSDTIAKGQLDLFYKLGLYGTLLFLALLAYELYSMKVRVSLLKQRLDNRHGQQHDDQTAGSGSPATGVVRPVGVSEEH